MKIEVNGKWMEISGKPTVAGLIEELRLDLKSTAVAVNKTIVPRNSYKETILNENDMLDLVTVAPGG